MFIGPTSQAPRVDETRARRRLRARDRVRQLPHEPADAPPWLVDRLFRNLLVDVTGNTHRAEFCIDKLYSPDSSSGRLGLLELRAFEMPPHARMSLAQQLLVRRWSRGSGASRTRRRRSAGARALHDRFLLPHFVEADFADVLDDLRRAGYALRRVVVRAARRVPLPALRARRRTRACEIELRQAIEPWYVLGEEPGPAGTARYVDSSVERLQVRVAGLAPERYVVTCNGDHAAAAPDGRGRANSCAACVIAPGSRRPACTRRSRSTRRWCSISWTRRPGRSVGGCTYHVAHPGGRSYETFPVNSHEAEARRRARFFAMGHTPGAPLSPTTTENPRVPSHARSDAGPASPSLPRAFRDLGERRASESGPCRADPPGTTGRRETAHHWDEVLDVDGRPRPHWRRLVAALRRMGLPEFARRWEEAQRLIEANGVTYNVYGDPRGTSRPWPLDLVPLAIDAQEWQHIERAVVQRATLLNAILADLYGPQRLLHDGRVPPELVFGNPGFLRPCRGIRPQRDVLPAQLRRGHRTRAERRVVGAVRPDPGALRRRLRAGKPAGHRAHAARRCSTCAGCKRLAEFFRHHARRCSRLAPRTTATTRAWCC